MRRVLEKKFTGVIIETSASFGLLYCPEKSLIEYRLIDFRDLAVGFIVSFTCKTSSDGTLKLKTAHPLIGRFGYRDNKAYPDPEFKVIQAPPSALPFTRMGIHEIFGNILVPSHQNFNIGDNIKVEIQFNDLLVEGFSWVATKLFDFPTRVYRKFAGNLIIHAHLLDGSRKFGIIPEHTPKGGKQSHRQQQLSRDFDRLNVEPVKEEAISKNDEQLVKKAVDQCAILNFEYIQDFNVLKCGENIKTQRQMMIIQIVENKYAIGLFLDPFGGYGVLSPTAFPEDGLQIGIVGEAHGRELSNPDTPSFSCMITAFDKIQDATWGGHAQVIDKKTFLFEVIINNRDLRGEPKIDDGYGKYDSTLGNILFNTASLEKLQEYGDCVFSIQHLKGHSTRAGWMAVSHSFVPDAQSDPPQEKMSESGGYDWLK